jgi:DNA-directed RNA polymerase, mitochondrial
VRAGLAFAGVHDSFWTHAGSVSAMNAILREKFIELHERPLLEELVEGWRAEYPGIRFPDPPPRGDLNLRNIADAQYFFS